jgi:phage terminase large subunit
VGGTGSGKCLSQTDKVFLANGEKVQAQELIDRGYFELLSLTEGGIQKTYARAAWAETEPIYEIITETGRRLYRNAKHPLFAAYKEPQNGTPLIGVRGFISISNLHSGDLIAAGNTFPYLPNCSPLDENEIKVVAYLIGDGGISRTSNIYFYQKPGPQFDEFVSCVNAMGGEARPGENQSGTYVSATRIYKKLDNYGIRGVGSADKKIPSQIFTLNKGQLSIFLSRLYSTDGYASVQPKNARIGFSSVSRQLLEDIQDLLTRFGIWSNIKIKNQVDELVLSTDEDNVKFCDVIGIYGKEEAVKRVRDYSSTRSKGMTWRYRQLPEGLRWERIDGIRELKSQPTVAITVPETGNYLSVFLEKNTWYAPYWVLKQLEKPGSRLLAIGLGYQRHVERTMIRELEECFKRHGIPYDLNKSLAEMTLYNGAKILFGSADNPMSLEGAHVDGGAWIDEAGQMPRLAWDVANRRTGFSGAPILLTTVPYFHNWLKKEVFDPYQSHERDDIEWIKCKSSDNLEYDPRTLDTAKRFRRPEYYSIYHEGEFAKPEGLIYPEPPDHDIIFDPEDAFSDGMPDSWPCYAGHDFGINNPTVGLWGRLAPNDTLYIVAEYEAPEMTMKNHIERWRRAGLDVIDKAWGDPAGADYMLTAKELGYDIEKANNDILAGVDLVYDRFVTGRLKIASDCKYLIDYRNQYVWQKNPKNEDESLDKPDKGSPGDHMMDALRYLCYGIFEHTSGNTEFQPFISIRSKRVG